MSTNGTSITRRDALKIGAGLVIGASIEAAAADSTPGSRLSGGDQGRKMGCPAGKKMDLTSQTCLRTVLS